MPSFPEAKKERIDYDMAADSTDDVFVRAGAGCRARRQLTGPEQVWS